MSSSKQKFMVFIDGSNMRRSMRELNEERVKASKKKVDMDYIKVKKLLKKNRNIIDYYYYEGHQVPISEGKVKFFKFLGHIGINAITKPLRTRNYVCKNCNHSSLKLSEKGIDTSLASDLIWFAFKGEYDTAIILSGDDDFMPPIEKIKLLGKKVEIYAFKGTVGREIKNGVDTIHHINDIIEHIKR